MPCAHRYDPYAAEGSTSASAGDADNTYENMKSLLALARMKQGAEGGASDERGGWKGAGRLKGGWAGGKDLGMIEEPVDPNAMPDSTDSESDSDSDDSVAAARVQARASSAPSRGIEKRKRKKEKKEKKEKSEPSAHTCTRTDPRAGCTCTRLTHPRSPCPARRAQEAQEGEEGQEEQEEQEEQGQRLRLRLTRGLPSRGSSRARFRADTLSRASLTAYVAARLPTPHTYAARALRKTYFSVSASVIWSPVKCVLVPARSS